MPLLAVLISGNQDSQVRGSDLLELGGGRCGPLKSRQRGPLLAFRALLR